MKQILDNFWLPREPGDVHVKGISAEASFLYRSNLLEAAPCTVVHSGVLKNGTILPPYMVFSGRLHGAYTDGNGRGGILKGEDVTIQKLRVSTFFERFDARDGAHFSDLF